MTIIRERLINMLGNHCAVIGEAACPASSDGKCTIRECATCLADHLIANGVTIQRWIPVSERLPEDDDRLTFYDDGRLRCTTVLAYTVYGRTIPKNRLKVRIVNNEYLDTQATDGWVWASGTEEVTHWMPLPLLPKEGIGHE